MVKDAAIGKYRIVYEEKGEGFPVLLIHGLAGDHNAWAAQIEALRDRYRLIAPDNRGAGRSTQIDEPITTEDMARDMLALMDAVGAPKFHVVGRSLGGLISQHMALIAPDRIQSIVMLAAAAKVDPIGHRVLMNMREVLQWTGSWADHARHSVQYFVAPKFFSSIFIFFNFDFDIDGIFLFFFFYLLYTDLSLCDDILVNDFNIL